MRRSWQRARAPVQRELVSSYEVAGVRLLAIGLLVSIIGCGLGEYHARDWWGLGYEEAEVEPGVFLVQYTSDRNSLGEIVEFWKRRSLELCQAKGKSEYEVVSAQPGTSNQGAVTMPVAGSIGYTGFVQYRHYAGYIRCKG